MPSNFKTISFQTDKEGQRADKLISELEEVHSRSQATKLFSEGLVLVKGKKVKASYKSKAGDLFEVKIPIAEDESRIIPYDYPLDIVFEDEDLIVINKPAGLVVHPSAGHEKDTLVNALVHYSKNLSMGFGEKRPGIVHRLDKDTSGLMVVAKNNEAHESLAGQFQEKSSHRVYYAIVYGPVKFETKDLTSYLIRHPVNRKRYCSEKLTNPQQEPKGKKAISHFSLIENFSNGLSLVKCQLETGRTHQIRVHISELGHPIAGDTLYGPNHPHKTFKSTRLKKEIKDCPRFALHAAELGFKHPKTQENCLFKAPWPKDLEFLATPLLT